MPVSRRAVSRSAGVFALALSIALVLLPTPQAFAVQLFADNFESGVLVPPWTATANFTNQTALVFAGTRAGRATTTGAGAYAYKDLSPAQTNVYLKTQIRVVSAAGTTPVLRFRQGGAGTNIISLNRNNSGALVRKNHVTASQDATSATTIALNTWYDLQIHAQINGTSSVFEVWLNGTLVSDISGVVSLGTAAIGRPQLGSNSTSNGYDIVYDDVVIDTAFIGGGGGTPPLPPTNVTATPVASNRVDLSWTASAGATSYNVIRTPGPNPGGTTGTTFSDTTVAPSTQYTYTVTATNGSGTSAPSSPPVVVTTPPGGGGGGTLIGAAGDIACDPADPDYNAGNGTASKCRAKFTAQQLSSVSHILALGDQQYDCGGLTAFNQSYAQSWGQASLLSKTHPILADEEYDTVGTGCGGAGADGYFSYFNSVLVAQPGNTAEDPSKGYYSFDVGAWHIVALNSECSEVGGCNAGSPQYNWLQADLAASNTACTLAYWHTPRFASKKNGPQVNSSTLDFWNLLQAEGAEAVLGGNSHFYERLAPRLPSGTLNANGIRQWVVGTGGKSHGGLADPGARLPGSEAGQRTQFGVLKLTLNATSYSWDYDVEGSSSFTDTGTTNCH
jgi:hypothetical protein